MKQAQVGGRSIAWLVAGLFFMENLDATIFTTALPQIAESLATQPVALSTAISGYMLALAVGIPASGWMADRYGARRVLAAAIVIFTAASALCGAATSLWQFDVARILQGLGGAMMVPVGRLAVLRATPKQQLVRAIAIITWPGLAAPVIGPTVGALIATHANWRWIFFINLPLGLIALVVTWRMVRGGETSRRPFDALGFVLTAVACSALMYSLDLTGHETISWPSVAAFVAVGAASTFWAVRHLARHPYPLVDPSATRVPTFASTLVGGSLFRMAIGTAPFLLPLMFQLAFGMDAITSGLLLLWLFAGNLLMKPGTTSIMRRFGFRTVLIGNGLLTAAGFLACAFFSADTPHWLIAAILFFSGMSRSMQFTVVNSMAFADVPPPQMTGANTLFSVAQQMSAAAGVAFGAVALHAASAFSGVGAGSPGVLEFRIAFGLVALLALAGVAEAFRLNRDAGASVSGHAVRG